LVASLAALGHTVTGIEAHSPTLLTLHAGRVRVTYAERLLKEPAVDLPFLSSLLDNSKQHWTLFKAAEVASSLFNAENSPWLRWLLKSSVGVVSDITGPLLSAYSRAGWRHRMLGNLSSASEAYNRLHIRLGGGHAFVKEAQQTWPEGNDELPFVFGYGNHRAGTDRHGFGAMVVAWRPFGKEQTDKLKEQTDK